MLTLAIDPLQSRERRHSTGLKNQLISLRSRKRGVPYVPINDDAVSKASDRASQRELLQIKGLAIKSRFLDKEQIALGIGSARERGD